MPHNIKGGLPIRRQFSDNQMKNSIKDHSEKNRKKKTTKMKRNIKKSFLTAIAKLRGESDADIQGIF